MAEHCSVPNSTTTASTQESELTQNNTTGYGFMRPSFSYLNAINTPHGSSQQSSSAPVMQPESPRSLQPMTSGLSMNPAPPFSYNSMHSNAGFSSAQNVRPNGTQEMGAIASAPAPQQSASHPAVTNSSHSATHFVSNNFNNAAMWIPPVPQFQVPMGLPRTPVTPGPPGIASSAPSNMPITPVLSNPTIQHQAVTPYPSPSPLAPPPGPWLQAQQISGFARPPFSPYAAVIPGAYPMPTHGMPPLSVALPDIQPPGVSPAVSAVGTPTSSFASGGQSAVVSGQADLPPGTDNGKHVTNAETKDGNISREQVDAWTAHRTETGTVYYYNALTGESTYEKPSGFKGEVDKATVQPSPVSWEKLAGTDWTLVTTNDGKRYYYNSTTQLSSWQIPTDVTELKRKQDADAMKTQSVSVTNINIVDEKVSAPVSLSTPAINTGGRDAIALRPSTVSGTSSALDLIKKKLQDSGIPASTSPDPALDLNGSKPPESTVKGPQNENNKDKHNGDMSDSSSDSEDEDRGPSKEECILQFKEMLKERGVAPFSKWEKELPKIVFDPRFKAVPSHSARRAIFEHFVRTRAEEERKEKRAAQKVALEGFKQLLEEAKEDIHHNTDYQTFKMKWGDDPRFRALDRKEREFLLNERVLPLKRAAQERAQAERAVAISSFMSMLQDKGDITASSRWSKIFHNFLLRTLMDFHLNDEAVVLILNATEGQTSVKDSLKTDPRYKSVKHEEREKLFNEYTAELKAAEEEIERKAKAKQDEEASWTESKTKLEKDPQGRAANPHLEKSDLEKLFRDHVKSLHERCKLEFRALLAEVITAEAATQETEDGKTIMNSWSTAKQLLKKDPRYNKVQRKEKESLWRRHAEDIQRKQKSSHDQETAAEGKITASVDSGKHRRTYDRR
ncbi:hypothetical protein BUALT_Bualt14G0042100 [Buddleja alternifolia]|uniref:Pre-mRNA-processing protein 40C n=1 Tax=Buddleja alternifolia TaxID=168488 RepID=A0AAV6WPE3_9LAMI|nr:hypothetical protein BUALT_Bualt14G0042100 [Buddleja alternifolia]